MPVLSAADAIAPAISRTRQFLFAPPFRWSTFLKLCLVAAITEGLGSNFHWNNERQTSTSAPASTAFVNFHFTPEILAAIVVGVLLLIVLALLIAYLVTRLRFAYFHCLVSNTRQIRPGWELYRSPAMRFFLMNIVVGICFLLGIALIALPFAAGFWHFFQGIHNEGGPNWALLISLIVPLIPLLILITLVAFLIDIALRDWMLPHYAIENATAGEAWSAVWMNIKKEKRQFFVYCILRVIAPIVAAFVLFVLLIIPTLISVGGVAAAEYGIHSAFADATGGASFAGVALEVFIGILAFVFALVVGISLGGPLSTGLREYAILFYGGRYPELGTVVFPPAPPVTQGIAGGASAV